MILSCLRVLSNDGEGKELSIEIYIWNNIIFSDKWMD